MNTTTNACGRVVTRPASYDSARFVNRKTELRLIDQKVEEGRYGRPITLPLLHLWGVKGIGKSWLLEHLYNLYLAGRRPRNTAPKSTFSALIRFRAVDETDPAVLEDIHRLTLSAGDVDTQAIFLTELAGQIQAQVPDARPLLADFWELADAIRDKRNQDINMLAGRFVSALKGLENVFVPVLLFDSVEALDDETFFWLESNLLAPIVQRERAVVVVAGRRQIPRWREFDARRRLDRRELGPFTAEETGEQLQRWNYPSGLWAQQYSYGLPYATQIFGEGMAHLAGGRPIDREFVRSRHADVIALLQLIETEMLKVAMPEQQTVIRHLSVLRWFNVESARRLMSKINEGEYNKPDGYYLRLFNDLENTTLVSWSREQRGYTLSPAVRRIIDLRLRLESELEPGNEEYASRHKRAEQVYDELMELQPHNRAALLIEKIYHRACYLQAQKKRPEQIVAEISKLLHEHVKPEVFETDEIDTLLQQLEGDKELQDEYVLPAMAFTHMREYIESVRQGKAAS